MNRPTSTVDYRVYHDGFRLIGIAASVTLPQVQSMTTTVSGGGIMGEIEEPVMSMFQNMEMTLPFRTVTRDIYRILTQQYHHIELWGAIQTQDPASGKFVVQQHKIVTRAMPKSYSLGNFNIANPQDSEVAFTVSRFESWLDNQEIIIVDKFNEIHRINGVDQNLDVLRAIGAS